MNQRYWNGHQWKDLPATSTSMEEPASINDAPADVPSPISGAPAPTEAAVVEIAVTPAETTTPSPAAIDVSGAPMETMSPTISAAITVPTHAEYGDAFAAAVAQEPPKAEG